MNKQEFLTELRQGLSGLPQNDIEERLAFYGEMLDDRIEEGLSEDAAVAEIGDADEIVRQILEGGAGGDAGRYSPCKARQGKNKAEKAA